MMQKKFILETTPRIALEDEACESGFNAVVSKVFNLPIVNESKYIELTEEQLNQKINLLDVLKFSGIANFHWALNNVLFEQEKERDVASRLMAADHAESVLGNYEDQFPGDVRVRNAIEVSHKFALGEATEAELSEAGEAAWSAARSAESAARSIWSATWSAESAESVSAESAARSAARSAESAARSAAFRYAESASAKSAAWSAMYANQDMEKFNENQIAIVKKWLTY